MGFDAMKLFSTEERGGIAGNMAYAIIAQGVGLLSSIVTSLVLPKVLGVDDYAYWQLFLLYSSYSGFALLGLNDGIYLRLGGKKYSEINHRELKGQQAIVCISQFLVACVCWIVIGFSGFGSSRSLVLALCVFYGLLTNLTQCLRYVFQSTNLTRISSLADLIAKALFLLCMAGIFLLGLEGSLPFILGFIVCQAIAFAYVLICARATLASNCSFKGALHQCFVDVRAGLKVMVAYYADSLIVGFTRMLTDWKLGLSAFGRLSLSFSLTNFVLMFIGQVSMVVFPVLKRLDSSEQVSKYGNIRSMLHIVLPFAYLLYVPAKVILGLWLPEYESSFIYLALTMPLCVYSCKANLLFNTYLKMARYEGKLCVINVAAMLLNCAFTFISILGFSSVELATCGIVATVMLRDLYFEKLLSKEYGTKFARQLVLEALMSVGFMACSWCMGVASWPVVAFIFVVYLWFSRGDLMQVISSVAARVPR